MFFCLVATFVWLFLIPLLLKLPDLVVSKLNERDRVFLLIYFFQRVIKIKLNLNIVFVIIGNFILVFIRKSNLTFFQFSFTRKTKVFFFSFIHTREKKKCVCVYSYMTCLIKKENCKRLTYLFHSSFY